MKPLSPDQQFAFDTIAGSVGKPGFRLFYLTGKAGTGKSYVTKALQERFFSKIRVCAMTGVAAQLIDGTTFHRVFGITPNPTSQISIASVQKNLGSCQIVIIDEVSQLAAGWFDDMCEVLKHRNITVVMVGDLFQLPPVPDKLRDARFSKKVFYGKWWSDVKWLMLTENHRQENDRRFGAMLDELRMGRVTPELRAELEAKTMTDVEELGDWLLLSSKRDAVHAMNMMKLAALVKSGAPYKKFKASLVHASHKDGWEEKCDMQRVGYEVIVAPGARVITLVNDLEGRYFNGSQGTVTSVTDGGVHVDFDDPALGSNFVTAGIEHTVYKGDGSVDMAYTQLPMMLAWSMTIHKAQGCSLDKVVISMDNHFADGMTYVCLSRCRTLDGLRIMGRMDKIKTAADVVTLYNAATIEQPGPDYVPGTVVAPLADVMANAEKGKKHMTLEEALAAMG